MYVLFFGFIYNLLLRLFTQEIFRLELDVWDAATPSLYPLISHQRQSAY